MKTEPGDQEVPHFVRHGIAEPWLDLESRAELQPDCGAVACDPKPAEWILWMWCEVCELESAILRCDSCCFEILQDGCCEHLPCGSWPAGPERLERL